jgi:hypothetical protein
MLIFFKYKKFQILYTSYLNLKIFQFIIVVLRRVHSGASPSGLLRTFTTVVLGV